MPAVTAVVSANPAWEAARRFDWVARSVARHAARWGIEYQDAVQTARIGVYRASVAYDPSRQGFSFLARRRAIDELRHLGAYPHRHLAPRPRTVSLDEPGEDGRRPIRDTLAVPPTSSDARVDVERLWAAGVSGLAERERFAIEGRFFLGLRLREIGQDLGVSDARVCQLVSSGVEKLRTAARSEAA